MLFQSTLPVRGATAIKEQTGKKEIFQSTLPVWGATAKMHKKIYVSLKNFTNYKAHKRTFARLWGITKQISVYLPLKASANLPGKVCILVLRS